MKPASGRLALPSGRTLVALLLVAGVAPCSLAVEPGPVAARVADALVVDGVAHHVTRLEAASSAREAAAATAARWRSDGAAPVVVAQAAPWHVVSRLRDGRIETVQWRDEGRRAQGWASSRPSGQGGSRPVGARCGGVPTALARLGDCEAWQFRDGTLGSWSAVLRVGVPPAQAAERVVAIARSDGLRADPGFGVPDPAGGDGRPGAPAGLAGRLVAPDHDLLWTASAFPGGSFVVLHRVPRDFGRGQ